MLVAAVGGSDKTTVSVATGHQEYHPVYVSPANLTNTARRAHGHGVLPLAFLPIPKGTAQLQILLSCLRSSNIEQILLLVGKAQRNDPRLQRFQRELYHACLEYVYSPLKPYMEKWKVVKCPDGMYRRAIFSIGPYIADYPEQVYLTGVVSRWCGKYVCQSRTHFEAVLIR